MIKNVLSVLCVMVISGPSVAVNPKAPPCPFTGTSLEQAKCLLRIVNPYREVGPQRTSLPGLLERLLAQPTDVKVSKESLLLYLAAHGIQQEEIGGPLADPVSQTSEGVSASYFIIHDTSDPTLARGTLFPPAGMDAAGWPGNSFSRYLNPTDCAARRKNPHAQCFPVAHVFVNRAGQSATGHNFREGWRSTQFEGQSIKRRGLFLSVENIQPRRKDKSGIDAEAPNPGFTDAQLDRLALVYVAASVRRGQWLIPCFHGVIDLGVGDHDDPQNFDLDRWTDRLNVLLQSLLS